MLKENKFLIGLGSITAVAAGGLIFWGLGSGSSLEEIEGEIASKKSTLQRMERLDPYPTVESAKEKAASLSSVLTKAREVRAKMLEFRPEAMDDIPASEFSDKLKASVAKVRSLYPESDGLPKGFNLGFMTYANFPAPKDATGELAYQLEAMEYLFTQLAEAGGKEVLNLHRPKIPMEEGNDWDGNSSGSKRRRKPTRGGNLPSVAHRMPVELTFRASESVIRDFLTRIGNSDQYFFQTRLGRVKNPTPIPSGEKGGSAEKSGGGTEIVVEESNDGIVVEGDGEIEVEGDAPVEETPVELPEKPVKSEQILLKVSGNESLDVFLRLDLLLFTEDQEFPKTQ